MKRTEDLLQWDMPTSDELADLAKRHDRRALKGHGEFRPFYFREALFAPPKKRFDAYLFQAQEYGWPVYYLAHFAGLHPIGASGGGDYWLARVAPDNKGTSRVYRYDHETGKLRFVFATIAELAQAAENGVDFEELPAPRAPKLASTDDPISLWARASWAAALMGASALDDWQSTLAKAAPLATFEREVKRLRERPDLAAYWLVAHGLLGNAKHFERADVAAKPSKNPFVASLRPRARQWLEAREEGFVLHKLPAQEVVRRLTELRKVAPKNLRSGDPPPLPAVSPAVTGEQLHRMGKDGKLLAFVAEHPNHERLHIWALLNIDAWAETDRGPIGAVERIARYSLTKKRLSELGTWISMAPLVSDSGQREAKVLHILVARRSPHATDIVLGTLQLLERIWTRPALAKKAVTLAVKLDPQRAKPIVRRMLANATWQKYDDVMAALRKASQ